VCFAAAVEGRFGPVGCLEALIVFQFLSATRSFRGGGCAFGGPVMVALRQSVVLPVVRFGVVTVNASGTRTRDRPPVNTAMDGVPGTAFEPRPGTSPWARAGLDVVRRSLNACVDKDFQ
jgi:hypothetical protein